MVRAALAKVGPGVVLVGAALFVLGVSGCGARTPLPTVVREATISALLGAGNVHSDYAVSWVKTTAVRATAFMPSGSQGIGGDAYVLELRGRFREKLAPPGTASATYPVLVVVFVPSVPAAAGGPLGSPSQFVWSDPMATYRSLAALGRVRSGAFTGLVSEPAGTVPDVVGLPLPNAEAVLGADHLVAVGIGSRVAQGIAGAVVRQSPRAGRPVRAGEKVRIYLASGVAPTVAG